MPLSLFVIKRLFISLLNALEKESILSKEDGSRKMFYTSDPRILVFSKNDKDTETKDTTRLSRIIPNLEIQMQQTSQLKLKP